MVFIRQGSIGTILDLVDLGQPKAYQSSGWQARQDYTKILSHLFYSWPGGLSCVYLWRTVLEYYLTSLRVQRDVRMVPPLHP